MPVPQFECLNSHVLSGLVAARLRDAWAGISAEFFISKYPEESKHGLLDVYRNHLLLAQQSN